MTMFTRIRSHLCKAALAAALGMALCAAPASAQEAHLLRIGTGGLLGVYYPVGNALAGGITLALGPDILAVAQSSGGSVVNIRSLLDHELEAGLAQADVALRALNGQGSFAGETGGERLRAIASLYPERLQIVVRRDSGIRSVRDFRGKTVSLDETGSGTLEVMRLVLEANAISEKDFDPVYLKPEFTTDRLTAGSVHGVCLVAGTPTQAFAGILGEDALLVPIDGETARRINRLHPALVPGVIPEGTYPGVPETLTVEVHALLLVTSDMDEAMAYALTRAIWNEETRALLRDAHPLARSIAMESATRGLSVPLHPGALRFYREQGLSPAGGSAP